MGHLFQIWYLSLSPCSWPAPWWRLRAHLCYFPSLWAFLNPDAAPARISTEKLEELAEHYPKFRLVWLRQSVNIWFYEKYVSNFSWLFPFWVWKYFYHLHVIFSSIWLCLRLPSCFLFVPPIFGFFYPLPDFLWINCIISSAIYFIFLLVC